MNKRERMERTLAGEATDRVPVALWRHWPGDDQRAADLARSAVDFQQQYDWDFLRVMPSAHYSVIDYGVYDEWRGAIDGRRLVSKPLVKRSLDWTEIRTLDPERGEQAKQLEALRMIVAAFPDGMLPIIQTVYSPLAQAGQIAGKELLLRHLRTHPDRLHTGLNVLTESTLRFIDALRRRGIDGIFYVMEQACYSELSEAEYLTFGAPYDRKILESLPERWWFNAIQVRGSIPMLTLASEYPAQVLNWADREAEISLSSVRISFPGVLCGGLGYQIHLHDGSPASVREAARDAILQTGGRRFILGAGDPVLLTSPLSNLRAAREIVDTIAV